MSDYGKKYFIKREIKLKHYLFALQWIIKLKPKNVFDYGCARGPFVHAFNFLKVPCQGYDISRYAVNNPLGLAKGKIKNNVPKKKFDTVICIDVLEHVPKNKEKKIINDLIELTNNWLVLSICDITLKDKYYDSTHCNLRTRNYWINQFKKKGMKLEKIPWYWSYKKQMYLFKKND